MKNSLLFLVLAFVLSGCDPRSFPAPAQPPRIRMILTDAEKAKAFDALQAMAIKDTTQYIGSSLDAVCAIYGKEPSEVHNPQ